MKKICFILMMFCGIALSAQVPDQPLLKLFDAAYRSDPHKNMMLSPWGIQQSFGMLIGSASKEDSAQLDSVLGLNLQSRNALREARVSMQKTQTDFNSFNAMLVDQKYLLKPKFVQDTTHFFGGKLYRLDYSRKKECVTLLNEIVKKESRNKFDNVFSLQDFDSDPAIFLLNFLSFKADWSEPFEKYMTREESFMTPSASNFEKIHHSSVEMMNDTMDVPYYNDGSIHGIILDYTDKRFKMLVLTTVNMPSSLDTVTSSLAQNGLQHFVRNSSRRYKTIIKLPRLKLENNVDLKSLLSSAGLKKIFDPMQSSFSMFQNSENLYVDQSRQILKLTLDEKGTDIASLTMLSMAVGCAAQDEIIYNKFYADHPFVLVLFDSQTQAMLLTAAIVNPGGK